MPQEWNIKALVKYINYVKNKFTNFVYNLKNEYEFEINFNKSNGIYGLNR